MKKQNSLNPIVIHSHLMQKFMSHKKDFANLLALYSFYVYHAQLQKTNQPLATDEFTKNGLNWALERVKKTKRLLKQLGVIEVIQKRKFYYIHLFFIYTKKKIEEVLKENIGKSKSKPTQKKQEKKSNFEKALMAKIGNQKRVDEIMKYLLQIKGVEKYTFSSDAFIKWIMYCHKRGIKYTKSNLQNWLEMLHNRTSIEQKNTINMAIKKNWKNFYILPITKSKYHQFLGRSIKEERYCEKLIDVDIKDDRFIYQFKNIRVLTKEPIEKLFERCEYFESSNKINSAILNSLKGMVKKF
jgi:predicted transcriptional regulator with HTH domain